MEGFYEGFTDSNGFSFGCGVPVVGKLRQSGHPCGEGVEL
jgi:hypothetical protein